MQSSQPIVGWIGTGVMGAPMVAHLITKGYEVHIHTRTKSKAEPLIEKGAIWEDSASELASKVDRLFLILGYPKEVEDLVLDSERGVLKSMKDGAILIDHTTNSPDLAVRIYEAGKARGVQVLDAPVTGMSISAVAGTLSSMVGGDATTLEIVRPLLECYCRELNHLGKAGSG